MCEMKEEISKQKFKEIFLIGFGACYDLEKLASALKISVEKAKDKVMGLENEGLAEVQYRENKVYCFQLTKKGQKIFDDPKYLNWKVELGY